MTYYFSTSGGHTESIQYSFVGALSKPWLVGVPDPYDFHLALPPLAHRLHGAAAHAGARVRAGPSAS